MTKKKAKAEEEAPEIQVDPFIGGEEDDLADMEYIQNEDTTMKVETQPPATKAEADMIAEQVAAEAEKKEEAKEDEPEEQEVEAKTEEVEDTAEEEPVLEDDEGIKVPKDRFDEVNDRMKKAEEENKSLKTQLETVVEEKNEEPAPEPYDYKTKEKESMDALLEGDAEKYSAINEEIRQAEKAEYLREAKKLAAQGDQQLQENLTFEEAGAKIEGEFPQFVEGTDSYSRDAREEMLDLYVGYAKSGAYTRVQALQRAADKAAKIYGLSATSDVTEETPDNVVDIKKPDGKKKAAVANAQPPAMENTGGGSEEPKIDVNSMSDEEFDALPESSKMRLRGDIL